MKTIVCFGDSNTWGNIPGSFDQATGLSGRYPKDQRWTGILQKKLGGKYNVVEEGINARTTAVDEIVPGRPYKNGLTQLPVCLETHYPIDLVILTLGTNDTKIQFNRSAKDITEGMRQLVTVVKKSNKGIAGQAPHILIITPQPIIQIPNLHPQLNAESIEKSKNLAMLYQQLAKDENCEYLNAGTVVTSSRIDGVHLDPSQSEALANAVFEKVRQIFANKKETCE